MQGYVGQGMQEEKCGVRKAGANRLRLLITMRTWMGRYPCTHWSLLKVTDVQGRERQRRFEKAPKKKTTKKKHIEVLEEKADDSSVESEEETCHTNQKEQVKAIAQHIKDVLALGIRVKKFEDLTKQTKDRLREPFPNTDECRYTPYWNRPACGFYLKSEGMDGGCFSVQVNMDHTFIDLLLP